MSYLIEDSKWTRFLFAYRNAHEWLEQNKYFLTMCLTHPPLRDLLDALEALAKRDPL